MATRQPEHYWTYEDLLDLPDDGRRYEIIEGVLYEMPAPNLDHASVIMNLILNVFAPLVRSLGLCMFTAPVEVFLGEGNPVQPDLVILSPEHRHLRSARGVEGPPPLVVEVLSPSNPEHDRLVKRGLYARAGIPEYWIVSPEAAVIEVLTLDGDRYRTHARVAGDETLTSTVLPTLASPAEIAFARP